MSRLKASEEIHKVATSKREEDIKMKETLEQQISQHREQHQKQVTAFSNLTENIMSLMFSNFMVATKITSKFRLI